MNAFTIPGLLIGLLWAAAAGIGAGWVMRQGAQITYVTLADGRRQTRRLPLSFRLLLPFAPNFFGWVRWPFFTRMRDDFQRRIVAAGYEGLVDGRELVALRLLMPIFGVLLLIPLHYALAAAPGRMGAALQAREGIFAVLALAWMFVRPPMWLAGALRARHKEIELGLPFTLDLLTLSVEAGLDFMTAIKRIIDRRPIDALNEELIRMFREVQLGKTRREALRDMAERVNQPDLRTVTHSLIQADELGVSIGAILRIQSDQMRTRRFLNAEKAANEAPVKMLAPLIGFIFPAVFLVLLGPVILQAMRVGL
ncbi:MAG: type II secretion system F family protein [Kiritimatiellae bacterium]|nr:type II secretion system F family protein [Kiritimatiellia bacterium]